MATKRGRSRRSVSALRTPWQRLTFSSGSSLQRSDERAAREQILRVQKKRTARVASSPRRKNHPGEGGAKRSVRDEILAGARRHFFIHGFRSATMDELARALGMSKNTIYLHFGDKEALFDAVVREKFSEVDLDLGHAAQGDFPAALQAMLVCLQQHLLELQPAFVRDMRRSEPERFARILDLRRKVIDRRFTPLLLKGQKSGQVRTDISVPVAIAILIGMTEAIVTPAKVAELQLTPQRAFALVLNVFLDGIKRRKR